MSAVVGRWLTDTGAWVPGRPMFTMDVPGTTLDDVLRIIDHELHNPPEGGARCMIDVAI